MVMNSKDKDRTVQILAGLVIIMLIFISIINPQNHSILYNFFTWLTWPTIFFIAGYMINEDNTIIEKALEAFKRYLVPYFVVGVLIIPLNKLIQLLHVQDWLNTPFAGMSKGLKALLYGNSSPTLTVFGYFDTGIGLLWILISLFVASLLMSIITKIRSLYISVFCVVFLAGLGSYLSSTVQLPWSLNSAMFGLPFMFFGVKYRTMKDWSAGSATIVAALILDGIFAMSSGLDMANANVPFWLLGNAVAFISLSGLIVFASYTALVLPKVSIIFSTIGSYPNINFAVFSFINVMLPVGNYVSLLLSNGVVNLAIVLSITLVITLIIKFSIVKIFHFQDGCEG